MGIRDKLRDIRKHVEELEIDESIRVLKNIY